MLAGLPVDGVATSHPPVSLLRPRRNFCAAICPKGPYLAQSPAALRPAPTRLVAEILVGTRGIPGFHVWDAADLEPLLSYATMVSHDPLPRAVLLRDFGLAKHLAHTSHILPEKSALHLVALSKRVAGIA